jgi:transposase-like protein
MREITEVGNRSPEATAAGDVLEEILRQGARVLLQKAIEAEVEEFLERYRDARGADGLRVAVRNGYMPERKILTGLGPIPVKQPRVDDRRLRKEKGGKGFTSRILPRYLRRVASIDNLVPALYLKGISSGDFPAALEAILGDRAPGLSATNVVRLKKVWEQEYAFWAKRDLKEKEYVYFWVDGIHFNVRLEDDRCCILVIMGADRDGNKELVAVGEGFRESKLSWKELLLDLKRRGLSRGPRLTIGDGGLGFWAALLEVFPESREQLCWVHKTANVLNKLPKSLHGKCKAALHEMYEAENKKEALKSLNHFVRLYQDKYPKATDCLLRDKDRLFTFYDFPAIHWIHIRTTNPVESTFATVRLRTKRTKGCGSRMATLTMVYKLAKETEKTWKRLKGYKQIPLVLQGINFVDGEMKKAA